MPGVVADHTKANKEIDRYAREHEQDWNVREAFSENLAIARQQHPNESHSQSMNRAIRSTKGEIRESWEMSMQAEEERHSQRESIGPRMHV